MSLFDNRMYKYILEEKWKRKTHAELITSTASVAQMGEKTGVAYHKWAQPMPWLLEHHTKGNVGMWESGGSTGRTVFYSASSWAYLSFLCL